MSCKSKVTSERKQSIRSKSQSQLSTASSCPQSVLSRLSYTLSPERTLDSDDSKHVPKKKVKHLWNWKKPANKGITEPKSDEQCEQIKSTVAKKNPRKTVNKVVNQDITDPNSDQESTVAKPNHRKTVNQVVNQDITDPNSDKESTVAKPNHCEQLNKVVNKEITGPNSHEQCDNSKTAGAKPNSRKKVNKLLSNDGKKDVNSVQQEKTTHKKAVAKGSNKEVTEDSLEQGIKCVQGEKMSAKKQDTNSKPEDEGCDNSEVDGSNLSCQVNPSPEICDFNTPLTFQSSPKLQSLSVEGNDNIESLCPCPFECGIEPCEITLMKHHIIEKHLPSKNCELDIKAIEEDNIIRKTFLSTSRGLITSSKFNKLLQENNYHEVINPGNEFCFISGLLITLAEQGVNKEMAVLAHEVMTGI